MKRFYLNVADFSFFFLDLQKVKNVEFFIFIVETKKLCLACCPFSIL